MPLILAASHHTATGPRERNEDVAGLIMPAEPELATKGMIAAVADGVSGSISGGEAAEYCVRTLLDDFHTMPEHLPVSEALNRVITAINQHVHQRGLEQTENGIGMATTLTSLVVRQASYHFAHVGDSRLYLLRDGSLQKLTNDHTGDHPETRHVLKRAVGLEEQIAIENGSGELKQDDIFLLASDGVWGSLNEGDIEWHLATLATDPPDPEYTAQLMINAALANGTKDNATAVVVRVLQLPEESATDVRSDHPPISTQPSVQQHPSRPWKLIGALSLLISLSLLAWLVIR